METEGTLRRRVSPYLILGGIFAVALFIRAFFAYELAIGDFLLSGGSDAFYFAWILDNVVTTGQHLLQDPMLNFPVGMVNPRPPIYAWSVALVGQLVGVFQGSVADGVGQTFLFSTAVWGALTIFPTYFLAKEMFGRPTGYIAAFFLAVLPAHIQRTPLSNGDHDALVLFFVVTAFYFLLKALASLRERSWVEAWWRPAAVIRGLGGLVTENRKTILLSVMAGTALAAIALTWKGWAYAVVIIIVYFLAQILVHKIRNQDPLGILLVFAITLGVAHLLAAPYYLITNQVRTWFDVPLYLFLASLGLGLVFAVFHRLPWMLVVPPIILGFLAGTAITAVYSPSVAAALSSGLGYFVPNKVFETIAEAQPPNLSQVILSFGAVTFYFSLAGIALLALQFIRRPRPDYLFVLVWTLAAIFMALSAVRFLFNASPAFAITAAWVVILIVNRLGLEQVGRAVATTGGSRFGALRKGVKIRHVAGIFLVAILVVLPNTWLAVDAGSPFEIKDDLEEEVLRVIPSFLQPPQAEEAGLFYFGAFGYTLPLPNRYFPQAWSWLRDQNADVFPTWERPAFLSWWDYGFEAIQEGRHPAVADNFQNGLEFAGHFLTSQSENEGIAVLNVRLLHGDVVHHRGQFSAATEAVLVAHGFNPDHVLDALAQPARFIPLVRSDPDRFGEWDARLSHLNTRIIYLRTIFVEALNLDGQVEFYRDLRVSVDASIGFFAVDSRLIPFSGTNTGIFYAVAKLTDHRVTELPDGRSIPTDFYRLIAVTPQGEFDLDQIPPGAQIQNIRIEYQDPWYHTMLYRIFFGPDGESLGLANEGLPGFTGALEMSPPRHGWMLEHFKLVYRTAYFNPHPREEAANFSEDFTAINLFDALEIQRQIEAGEREGVVDTSHRTGLRLGIVILQYHDGALLRGRVTTEAGTPVPGARVTTLDELDTPHAITFADERGFYEALLPFGQTRVAISSGRVNPTTGIGNLLVEEDFNISETQALRMPLDEDGTGFPSFVVERDFVVQGGNFHGTAFMDANGNGRKDPGEPGLPGLDVSATDLEGEAVRTGTVSGPDGTYELGDLIPTEYRLDLTRNDQVVASTDVFLSQGEERRQDLAVPGATLSGVLTDEFGQATTTATVQVLEVATGEVTSTIAGENGTYRLEGLFEGTYEVEAEAGQKGTIPRRIALASGSFTTLELRVEPLGRLSGRTLLSSVPTPHVTVTLQRQGEAEMLMVTSDPASQLAAELPLGTYDAYALHFAGGRTYAFLGQVKIGPGNQILDFNLRTGHRVEGRVDQPDGETAQATVTFEAAGAQHAVTTGADGAFVTFLPSAQYQVVAQNTTGQRVSTIQVVGSTEVILELVPGLATEGRAFRDLNGNGTFDPGEGLSGIRVDISTPSAPTFTVLTGLEGVFAPTLIGGASYVWSIAEDAYEPVSIGPSPPGDLGARAPIELVARNVTVAGQLTSGGSVNLAGLEVSFAAVSNGAVSAAAATGAQGSLSTLLQPGIYRVVVDVDAPPGDGSRRIQAEGEFELRVPVGGGTEAFGLPVVERVRVQGTFTSGSAFGVPILFDGPDRAVVDSGEAYLVYLRPGAYTISGATGAAEPLALLTPLDVTDPMDFNATFQAAFTLSGQLRVGGETVTPDVSIALTRVADGARVLVPSEGSGEYRTVLVPATYRATAEWTGVDRLDGMNRFVRYDLDQALPVTDNGTADLVFERTLVTQPVEVRVLLGGQLTSARVTFQAANETAVNVTVDVPAGAPFPVPLAPGIYHVYAFRQVGNSAALAELEVLSDEPKGLTVSLEQGYRVFGVATLPDGSRRTTQLGFQSPAGSAGFTTDSQGGYEVFLPAGPYELQAFARRDEGGLSIDYRFSGAVELEDSTLLNLLLARVDVRTVQIAWDPDQRTLIAPGDTFTYTITVTNTGNMADTFGLEGTPEPWVFSFRPSRVSLPAGAGTSAEVTVQITAPADAEAPEEFLAVSATSLADPTVIGVRSLFVDVVHFRGLALDVSADPPVLDAEALEYEIDVKNDGNGEDTFEVVLTNPEVLAAQGWAAELLFEDQSSPENITGIVIPARSFRPVTLRLEPQGRVSTSTATFLAFSEVDRKVEAALDVEVGFPVLEIPRDQLQIEGKRVRIGPPEFPILLYGALAAAAIGITVLFITYGRRRRRR